MPASFDYTVIRVVPRVERQEFINAAVVLFCPEMRFLAAHIHLDEQRLKALWADRESIAARALSLAQFAAQHDHPAVAGAYGDLRRAGPCDEAVGEAVFGAVKAMFPSPVRGWVRFLAIYPGLRSSSTNLSWANSHRPLRGLG